MEQPKPSVLYVDDEPENLSGFKFSFRKKYEIFIAHSGKEGLGILEKHQSLGVPIQLVITDQRMPQMTGVEFLEQIAKNYPDTMRIVVTGYSDVEAVMHAINKGGAFRYLTKPWGTEELSNAIEQALDYYFLRQENRRLVEELTTSLEEVQNLKQKLEEENLYLKEEVKLNHSFDQIISSSKLFRETLQQVEQVAPSDSTVLILGETGTGKELLAKAVHHISNRKNEPLVKVNCAALPSNLIESELFGHEKGAFTGAISRKIGRFELADKGSIFLDEIGELPLELQSKLLRVLQEGEVERLGGSKVIKVDVRIIAATNRDLQKEVEKGNFRADLYYRLYVFPINTPALRDRKEDIIPLVRHFVEKYSSKMGKNIEQIPKPIMNRLEAYHWPGNVRELENIIERAVIISSGKKLELGDWLQINHAAPSAAEKIDTLEDHERKHIIKALKMTNWRVSGDKGAAKILDINDRTLQSRMKKLDITRDSG